ncbi:MAG: hypothetical protein ACYSYV_02860 [Planctomycetota bacterium]|jgi:hypothetical protein
MKDVFKNPILYYIATPVVIGLWPLLVWAMYLPAAQKGFEDQRTQYERVEPIIVEILTLDPDRLEFADSNDTAAEFTYPGAVDRVARLCDIPETKYKLSSAMIMTTREQKSQSANVDLKQVDITKFAKFLSMIQLRWEHLQCEQVKLTKKQGVPDADMWDVDIKFKYYY